MPSISQKNLFDLSQLIWRGAFGVIFLLTFLANVPVLAQATGPYRLIYPINNSGIAMVDYQIDIYFDTATLISKFKMRTDCADIRLLSDTGTALSFWLESGCNTTTTHIIVKIPAINPGVTTFWLDFGNFALTSTSNSASVAVFSDQMATTTTCTLGGSAVLDTVNQYVRLNPLNGGFGSCNYNYNPGSGFIAKFDFWSGGGNGADSVWFYAFDNSIPTAEDITTGGYHFTYDEYQDRVCYTKSTVDNGAGIACGSVTNLDNSTWKAAEVRYYNHQALLYIDGVLITSGTNATPIATTGNFFGFAARIGGLNNEHRIRKTYVSKYSPFIILSAPSEQVYVSMTIRDISNTVNTNSCDFGIASTLSSTQCIYRIAINTNATNGYQLFSQTSGGLKRTGSAYVISNALAGTGTGGGSPINNATNGIERYGVKINPGNTTAGNNVLLPNTPFYVGSILAGANSTSFSHTVNTLTINSPFANLPAVGDTTNTITMTHNLNISPSTPSGAYTQRIVYTLIANF